MLSLESLVVDATRGALRSSLRAVETALQDGAGLDGEDGGRPGYSGRLLSALCFSDLSNMIGYLHILAGMCFLKKSIIAYALTAKVVSTSFCMLLPVDRMDVLTKNNTPRQASLRSARNGGVLKPDGVDKRK